jgi:biotin synthase-like enzyme
VRGYLTTPGQSPDEARRMIEEMGFEVEERAEANAESAALFPKSFSSDPPPSS